MGRLWTMGEAWKGVFRAAHPHTLFLGQPPHEIAKKKCMFYLSFGCKKQQSDLTSPAFRLYPKWLFNLCKCLSQITVSTWGFSLPFHDVSTKYDGILIKMSNVHVKIFSVQNVHCVWSNWSERIHLFRILLVKGRLLRMTCNPSPKLSTTISKYLHFLKIDITISIMKKFLRETHDTWILWPHISWS